MAFGEKPPKLVDLLEISNFLCKVPCTRVFHPMPYFLQHFAKNWVKTLVHSTLRKKVLISRRSTSFGGFSPNAILFSTFC